MQFFEIESPQSKVGWGRDAPNNPRQIWGHAPNRNLLNSPLRHVYQWSYINNSERKNPAMNFRFQRRKFFGGYYLFKKA